MRKKSYKTSNIHTLYIFGVLFHLFFILTSCSENEETYETSNEKITQEEQLAMKQIDAIRTILIELTGIDELTDDFDNKTYQPSIGKIMDEATPFVRSLKIENAEEAEDYFMQIIGQQELATQTADGYTLTLKKPVNQGEAEKEFGTLTFHKDNAESKRYAHIDINIPNIPTLERIDFIPANMWGDNDSNNSPFQIGEIVYYNNQTCGGYYVCVRECDGPYDGLLVHMDEGYNSNYSYRLDDDEDNGCWVPKLKSGTEDVKAYISFIHKFGYLLQKDVEYLQKTAPNEVQSIAPTGMGVNGYVYNRDEKPAAIIMESYYGDWRFWSFCHYRHCNYYYIPPHCKTGSGSYKTSIDYTSEKDWYNNVYNSHHTYTISTITFGESKPTGMSSSYDPDADSEDYFD